MTNIINKIDFSKKRSEELQDVIKVLLNENQRIMCLLKDTKEALEMAPNLRFMKERIQNELDLSMDLD